MTAGVPTAAQVNAWALDVGYVGEVGRTNDGLRVDGRAILQFARSAEGIELDVLGRVPVGVHPVNFYGPKLIAFNGVAGGGLALSWEPLEPVVPGAAYPFGDSGLTYGDALTALVNGGGAG